MRGGSFTVNHAEQVCTSAQLHAGAGRGGDHHDHRGEHDAGDDDDSILFPALVATGALVALGGAGLMVRGRTLPPGGATTADVTDEELRAAASKEFGGPAPTANTEEDWRLLVHGEQQVQQRVEEEVQRALDAVSVGLGDFLKAADDYRSTFTLVMSSTTEMQGLLVEWDEVKSIARKQDLAFGIVTLAWSGGSLGLKALKWHRLPAGMSLVIDRLLHATRQAVAGRGSIAPDDVAQLKLWAGRPGFYGELARSASRASSTSSASPAASPTASAGRWPASSGTGSPRRSRPGTSSGSPTAPST